MPSKQEIDAAAKARVEAERIAKPAPQKLTGYEEQWNLALDRVLTVIDGAPR
jgi:hypothetical protein